MILRTLIATQKHELIEDFRSVFGDESILLASAGDLSQMWKHLRSKPCDLVIADAQFFRDKAQEFQELSELPDAPEAIVLLQEDSAEVRAEYLDVGALACVVSEMERRTLYRTIRALVKRARRSARQGLVVTELSKGSYLSDFASKSPAMQRFLKTVRKVVDTNSSLLILGETGAGKEFLARAIHMEGSRKSKPFIPINCGALPENLLEAELFGHVAGAFTGAQKARRGYFELGHTGTVFLDEVGELPLHLQVKLLRVLQEKVVQPLGSEKPIAIEVRVIAATNRDLKEEVEAKRFRADLFYRFNVITLTVPPLRERREDIPDLVESNIEHFRNTLKRPVFGIQPAAMDALLRYEWPGNVRELINVLERAVLLTDAEEITVADLPEEIVPGPSQSASLLAQGKLPQPTVHELASSTLHEAREIVLEWFERGYIEALLQQTKGRIGEAAEIAGITPRSLYDRMKRLGLRKETFKTQSR